MELEKLQTTLKGKKPSTYFTIVYRKDINGYVKTTTTTVRLATYNNVKAVKEMKAQKALLKPMVEKTTTESKPKVSNDIYLGNNIIFNKNTQKARLQVFLTNCPNHKPHSVYEYGGNEISAEEWYANTGKKPSTPTIMFDILVDDIVMVK